MNSQKAYNKLLAPVNCKYGAPMGRANIGVPTGERIYDREVIINSQGYDKGGAYWGIGRDLRVSYNKDLTYVRFYRV